jgi:glutathione synthase/RimK-type ligase-like ATP-grasp enzyme
MMSPKILIVSAQEDPHVHSVTRHLEQKGVEWILVDLRKLSEESLTLHMDKGQFWFGEVEISEYNTIWYRRAWPTLIEELTEEYLEWSREEFKQAFLGALLSLNPHWISYPLAIKKASFKPLQLYLARSKFGFNIPKTLITSNPKKAREFVEHFGLKNCIAKCLGAPFIEEEKKEQITYIFTNSLDNIALSDLEDLKLAPCIFQTFVEKQFEVRLNVVGEQVLAAKIYSSELSEASIDWRTVDHTRLRHEPIMVPKQIESACIGLCKELGLRFGALDFIVDPHGEWYFLEINANGQWQWVEDMTGLPISKALADELSSHH